MKKNIQLLVIDPQNDFCDLPSSYLPMNPITGESISPSLPVSGAHADMVALASVIKDGMNGISGITVTLDSHQRLDIAHPTFWSDTNGNPPAPFTQITVSDLEAGIYRPRDESSLSRAMEYLIALEAAGRYKLIIWPIHCEIGSWGHNVHLDVRTAYNQWEDRMQASVVKISKGSNPWTEHYSAVEAEVPDEKDIGTQTNQMLLNIVKSADVVYIAGEAGSHCVKATTEHIVDNLSAEQIKRLVLITDCISPVTGFEAQQVAFMAAMEKRGVRLVSSKEAIAELVKNA
jgi:nicotinamidase/pyrazinamidase